MMMQVVWVVFVIFPAAIDPLGFAVTVLLPLVVFCGFMALQRWQTHQYAAKHRLSWYEAVHAAEPQGIVRVAYWLGLA